MQYRHPMSVINPSIPKVQENKIQSMKLKMPGMERQRGWAFSRCVRLSSGYSMIHFSFSLNTGHKRVPVPRPQSLHFVEVISGWKSQGGEALELPWVYRANKCSYN